MAKRNQFFLIIFFSLLLTACHRCPVSIENPEGNCGYCGTCESIEDQRFAREPGLFATENELISDDINVVHVGEYTTLIVPADDIFYPRSPRILPQSKSTLKLIDYYLRFFDLVRVDVVGYTDDFGNPFRNKALSQARAENVMNFMWRDGIDARLISAKGLGLLDPIATNQTRSGRSTNRRIEISFKIYNSKVLYNS